MPVLSLTSELCLLSLSIALLVEVFIARAGFSAEEQGTESLWAELPEELWAKVLQALPAPSRWSAYGFRGWCGCTDSAAVRLVCSGWQAVHDAMVMRLVLHDPTDEAMGMLVRRFPAVASLELKGVCEETAALTDKGMRAVSNCTTLTSLNFSSYDVTDEGLRLVSSLPMLTFLDISSCEKVSDVGIRAVSCCTTLTELNLARSSKVTNAGVRAVIK
jgi:hypothetical protein